MKSMTSTAGTMAIDDALRMRVRGLFPALSGASAPRLFDHAGGSQLPGVVIDAMVAYMTGSFVQTGADYEQSVLATRTVERAHQFLRVLLNAASDEEAAIRHDWRQKTGVGEVIIGPSTSQLCKTLAEAYAGVLRAGDEVIVCDTAHESNVGPWVALGRMGVVVRRWGIDRATACGTREQGLGAGGARRMEALRVMLNARTRLVCVPQVSNVLGEVVDVREIARLAHGVGARVVVDGVAFAPHRALDVRALECDWYVFSTYKVFGPHAAAMFGTHDALAELTGPNHFFIPREEVPRKMELGGANHECCAGLLALDVYLRQMVSMIDGEGDDAVSRGMHPLESMGRLSRTRVERAFEGMRAMEEPLQEALLEWARRDGRLLVIGPDGGAGSADRVCTISMVRRDGGSSGELARALNARGECVRFGNFYAYRLCEALGLDPADGVLRASFAHTTTLGEVLGLCAALGEELDRFGV